VPRRHLSPSFFSSPLTSTPWSPSSVPLLLLLSPSPHPPHPFVFCFVFVSPALSLSLYSLRKPKKAKQKKEGVTHPPPFFVDIHGSGYLHLSL
jgi:hypothetical protein